MGRALGLDEYLPSGVNRIANYTYDWAGNQRTSTDGAGVTTTYSVSPANEVLSMTSSLNNGTNPANILSNVQNGPNGTASYNLGNGLAGGYSYDTLGRMSAGAVTSGGTQVYGFSSGWKGSQLQSSSDTVLGQTPSRGTTYGYDEFNRLTSQSVNSGSVPSLSWVYDHWGNRTQQNVTAGSGPSPQYGINTATNQIVGYSYDAAGNMTYDGTHSYTYDAEGNIVTVDGGSTATYVYNALNQRVRTLVGTTATEVVFNAGGQRVSEWNASTHVQIKGHYYWGGTPVAYYDPSATHFEHQDWLGTERMRTTSSGAVEGKYTSLPWGDGQTTSGTDTDANHYAMLDHDAETDTDHAQFRQYSNVQGRFMSPDPYDGSYDASNPQSMNRYVYALNNPLSNVDPTGKDACIYDDGNGGGAIYYDEAGGCGGNGYWVPEGGSDGGTITYVSFDDDGNLEYKVNGGTLTLQGAGGTSTVLPGSMGSMAGTAVPSNTSNGNSGGGSGGGGAPNNSPKNGSFPWGWPINGNMLPLKPGTQDNKCTTGPLEGPMDQNPAVLSCCQAHDNCYAANQCNATSWIPNPLPWGACNVCNAKVAACITGAVLGH
jgi:RHS repeat-associated protein